MNDCRHYLNDLCFYLTRENAVSSKFVKHSILKRLEQKKGQIWEHHLWLTKALTDVENVEHWNKAGRFAGATIMFGMGTRFMPFVPAKRFVTWGSGVIAGTSENVPVVREVLTFGGFLVDTGRSALSLLFDTQTAAVKTISRGIEMQFLHGRSKAVRPRRKVARLAHSSSYEDLSSPRVGVRVSPSSITLPTAAISASAAVRSAFGSCTNRCLKILNAPMERINSFAVRRFRRSELPA